MMISQFVFVAYQFRRASVNAGNSISLWSLYKLSMSGNILSTSSGGIMNLTEL